MKNLIRLWLVVGIVLSSCSLSSPEQAFSDLRIDKPYFRSLPLCEQVRVYAQVGSRFMDRDHFLVMAPDWVEAYIEAQPSDALAACIAEEGKQQIGLLMRMPDQKEQISLVIHALSYIAFNQHLIETPEIEAFVREAVCKANVEGPGSLALLISDVSIDPYSADYSTQLIRDACSE